MLKTMQEVLEYSFDVLNEVYFNGELPPIVITLQSSPKSHGHFTVGRVWRAEEEHLNEINISVEFLDRPIENIIATLCHEMVHYYCQLKGIQDTSQGGRYHNKNFKRVSEEKGLIISYRQYIGYSVTTPSPEFIEVLKARGIEKPLDINRDGVFMVSGVQGGGSAGTDMGLPIAPTKPKSSTRKYMCPCCGNSFRATKDINVLCIECGEVFIKA